MDEAAFLGMVERQDNLHSSADVEQLLTLALKTLETGDFQTRWEISKVFPVLGAAALRLGSENRVFTPLIEILQDEESEWELRWFSARILGEFDHPMVINALVELLRTTNTDEDEDLSAIAAEALSNFGTSAVTALSTLLASPEHRGLAVRSLAQIRNSATIEPLLQVVQDPQVSVRVAAIEALSSFHDDRVPPVLVQSLSDPAVPVRREAVTGLGFRPDLLEKLDLVSLLKERLWDLNLEVCHQAAISLGRLGTTAAVAALLQVLQSAHTPTSLQIEAVRALGWQPIPQTLDALQQVLGQAVAKPDSLSLCQEIITVLGQIQGTDLQAQAAQILIQVLQDTAAVPLSPRIQQAIAIALGQLQNLQALDPLIMLLAEPDMGVQLHAIAALKQLSPQLAYERLETMVQNAFLSPELQDGIRLALQEWHPEKTVGCI